MVRKPSRGRQKIPMLKMQNENNLQVTFSKRRSGIMKKTSELCTRTGAEVAVIIFSPGKKAYSFGNPSVESVLNRFQNLNINQQVVTLTERLHQIDQMEKMEQLNLKIELLNEEIETEDNLKESLDQISENEGNNLEDLVEGINLEKLQTLKLMFSEIRKRADKEMKKLKNLEIQKEEPIQLQNFYEHPRDADIEKASGFNFTRGEASSSTNNGIDLNVPAAPPVDSFVVPGYGPE